MTDAKPVILGHSALHRGYLSVDRVRYRLDGKEVSREVERHGDAAVVLPYDPVRRCALLVRLPRAPVLVATGQSDLVEACAGMIGHDENSADAARREAREELGLTLVDLEQVGRVWSSPGVSTERLTLFLAAYSAADRKGEGGADGEDEAITVLERPLAALADEADCGEIVDAKLLLLLQMLRLRQPALFGPAA
ncbi:NUDIX hydrolase [Phenylobacterium sp.]|uniref:NUDIX domain-containing protein n=1 Tax=Phenylobacterium sp. TaxID=1871053 RepID=UPI0011FA0416|nr:NUDIX hydrolase [Phenylobacterium sp.]THD60084.1 MAG: NUDIX hydrolase [Phenylobacterium sp.]